MNCHQVNWLEHWRLKSGLLTTEVDHLISVSQGKTNLYEAAGFLYVPCCDLVKMAELYQVSEEEFFEVLAYELRWYRNLLR